MSAEIEQRSWLPSTLGLIAVVALVFSLRSRLPVEEWLGPVRDWTRQFGARGALVLGVGIALMTAFGMPGSVMAIVCGVALGMGLGVLTAWCGMAVGSALCFLLSRWIFGDRVNSFVEVRPRLVALREAVGQRGWWVLLMLRLTPLVPLVVTNYLAGVSGVRFWGAALATALGIMPATMVYVGLGAAGSSEPQSSALLVGIGLVATVSLGLVARRILREVLAA